MKYEYPKERGLIEVPDIPNHQEYYEELYAHIKNTEESLKTFLSELDVK